jgi:hypothetical protein
MAKVAIQQLSTRLATCAADGTVSDCGWLEACPLNVSWHARDCIEQLSVTQTGLIIKWSDDQIRPKYRKWMTAIRARLLRLRIQISQAKPRARFIIVRQSLLLREGTPPPCLAL